MEEGDDGRGAEGRVKGRERKGSVGEVHEEKIERRGKGLGGRKWSCG